MGYKNDCKITRVENYSTRDRLVNQLINKPTNPLTSVVLFIGTVVLCPSGLPSLIRFLYPVSSVLEKVDVPPLIQGFPLIPSTLHVDPRLGVTHYGGSVAAVLKVGIVANDS